MAAKHLHQRWALRSCIALYAGDTLFSGSDARNHIIEGLRLRGRRSPPLEVESTNFLHPYSVQLEAIKTPLTTDELMRWGWQKLHPLMNAMIRVISSNSLLSSIYGERMEVMVIAIFSLSDDFDAKIPRHFNPQWLTLRSTQQSQHSLKIISNNHAQSTDMGHPPLQIQ